MEARPNLGVPQSWLSPTFLTDDEFVDVSLTDWLPLWARSVEGIVTKPDISVLAQNGSSVGPSNPSENDGTSRRSSCSRFSRALVCLRESLTPAGRAKNDNMAFPLADVWG